VKAAKDKNAVADPVTDLSAITEMPSINDISIDDDIDDDSDDDDDDDEVASAAEPDSGISSKVTAIDNQSSLAVAEKSVKCSPRTHVMGPQVELKSEGDKVMEPSINAMTGSCNFDNGDDDPSPFSARMLVSKQEVEVDDKLSPEDDRLWAV